VAVITVRGAAASGASGVVVLTAPGAVVLMAVMVAPTLEAAPTAEVGTAEAAAVMEAVVVTVAVAERSEERPCPDRGQERKECIVVSVDRNREQADVVSLSDRAFREENLPSPSIRPYKEELPLEVACADQWPLTSTSAFPLNRLYTNTT
jgi:hypothetical protein